MRKRRKKIGNIADEKWRWHRLMSAHTETTEHKLKESSWMLLLLAYPIIIIIMGYVIRIYFLKDISRY